MQSIHQGQPVLTAGVPLEKAKAAMIMMHGRGADARSILSLSHEFTAADVAYFAPQANGGQWYPYRFMEPIQQNQPYLDSALRAVHDVMTHITTHGLNADTIMLIGFSQGACLTLEYAVRHAQRYGGVFGLSGGLIGEPGTQWEYPGTLDRTPVFLGCDPQDFHIPEARIHESAAVFERYGAHVTKRLYPNMGHTINQDEIAFVNEVVSALTG